MIKKITLYWRTLKYLTFSQIYYLVRLAVKKKLIYRFTRQVDSFYKKAAKSCNCVNINILNFGTQELHQLLGGKDLVNYDQNEDAYTFTFLKHPRTFKQKIDWNPEEESFLWRYNLNYSDYAYDMAIKYQQSKNIQHYNIFKKIVEDWIENNPVACHRGWDPYPTSLRVVNWIKAYHLFFELMDKDPEFKSLVFRSIYTQAAFLENNVEHHLKNNHVVENGRGLFVAGCFFNDKNAKRWKRKGLDILWKELAHQVLDDGGQFELSPMYHAVVMLNYMDTILILQGLKEDIPEWVLAKFNKMVDFLELTTMPDGEIAYFNDAAQGMTVPNRRLIQLFHSLNFVQKISSSVVQEKLVSLPDSGYFILQNDDKKTKCIFDCGSIGPDYQPGHGHCDTLSFVWAYNGQRIIVDSGVDDYYRVEDWREYHRSTRAHSTVEVDEVDQSEMWGNFRVGKRAHPVSVSIQKGKRINFVQGSHDGYFRLSDKVLHRRTVALLDEKILIVFDELDGIDQHEIKSYLHLHPDFSLDNFDMNKIKATGNPFDLMVLPFGKISNFEKIRGQKKPLQGWYSPAYGQSIKNDVLAFVMNGKLPCSLGYCLVPMDKTFSPDQIALNIVEAIDGSKLHLKIENMDYHLTCNSKGVFLES